MSPVFCLHDPLIHFFARESSIFFYPILSIIVLKTARSLYFTTGSIYTKKGKSDMIRGEMNIYPNSGIYGIRNLKTGQWYIGQSVDIPNRIRATMSKLHCRYNENPLLQLSYDQHGKAAFCAVVLEYAPPEKLNELEQKWIDTYKANQAKYGYNMRPVRSLKPKNQKIKCAKIKWQRSHNKWALKINRTEAGIDKTRWSPTKTQ